MCRGGVKYDKSNKLTKLESVDQTLTNVQTHNNTTDAAKMFIAATRVIREGVGEQKNPRPHPDDTRQTEILRQDCATLPARF